MFEVEIMYYLPGTNVRCYFRTMRGQEITDTALERLKRDLRTQVADIIVNEKIETTIKEEHVLYSLDVYVLTPDELTILIKKEAEKYAYFLGPRKGEY